MPLVKNIKARKILRSAVVLDLGDVRAEADAIVAAAHAEAARLLADTREEVASITHGAKEFGRAQGHAIGLEEGLLEGRITGKEEGTTAAFEKFEAEFSALNESWAEALAEWKRNRSIQREEGRRDLLRLSLGIAERVLRRLPKHDPTLIVEQVAAAIDLLLDRTTLTIRMNPEDRPLLEAHLPALLAATDADLEATLEEDASIARGGCVVSTPEGDVDARLGTQIERLTQALFPELTEDPR